MQYHPHRHHHWGSWGGWGSLAEPAATPSTTLVNVTQQATAIALGGGTAIAINITYIYL